METSQAHPLHMNTVSLQLAAQRFRAVNNRFRMQMLHVMHRKKKLMVTDLSLALEWGQSSTSQHLAVLRRANIVVSERKRNQVYYTINYDFLALLHRLATHLVTTP